MKKKSVKFNAIDLIVILIVIFVFIIFAKYFFKNGNIIYDTKNTSKIELLIETSAIKSDYLLDSLKVGEPIAECKKNETIGTISDCSIIEIHKDKNSTTDDSIFCKLRLRVIVNAKKNNNQYFINGEQLLINKENEFSVPNLYFKGKYISISEINSELPQQTNNNLHKNGGNYDQ